MRSEEFQGEMAGLIARLGTNIVRDARYSKAFAVDNEDSAVELTLQGIEDAIVGLIMLHVQVRRRNLK